MTIRNLLEDDGFAVLSTADGPHGISLYRDHRPDLVLLDLGLPTMDGLQVLKEMKLLNPAATVIIITGYASPQAMSEAVQQGAHDLLEKPIRPETLLEKVKSALSASKQG